MDLSRRFAIPSLLGYALGAVALGSLTAAWLVPLLGPESAALAKGAPRFARRCMMAWGLLLAPFLVLALGTFQRGDHGWAPWTGYTLRPGRSALGLGVAGLLLGLLSLGSVMALALAFGSRAWDPSYPPAKLALNLLLAYPIKCLAVALLEETVVRGYLLRALCRSLGAWPAMVLASGLFAGLHFLYPAAAAFHGDGVVSDAGRVLGSSLTAFAREPRAGLQFVSLFCMSLLLCLVVLRTGVIWPAVGLHAGWVWVKLANGVLADRNSLAEAPWFFGGRSDHLDSLSTVFILGVLSIAVGHSWRAARRAARDGRADA